MTLIPHSKRRNVQQLFQPKTPHSIPPRITSTIPREPAGPRTSGSLHTSSTPNTSIETCASVPRQVNNNSLEDTWVYFTVRATFNSRNVDIFFPDADMCQHAITVTEVLPIRLENASDFIIYDTTYAKLETVVPLEIYFRMRKIHAEHVTDAELTRLVQLQCDQLRPKIPALVEGRSNTMEAEILSKVDKISIRDITRSRKPSEQYSDMAPNVLF